LKPCFRNWFDCTHRKPGGLRYSEQNARDNRFISLKAHHEDIITIKKDER
jgi:hypothetical protein